MLIVPQNVAAPTALTVRFLSPLFGPDLRGVTSITAGLLRRDGTQTTLTFAIVSAASRELTAQYTFAGSELTSTGAYYLAPVLALPGGHVASETIPLFVAGPFHATPQLEQDAWLLATVSIPSGGAVKSGWTTIAASTVASPYGPHMALDLRGGPLSVTLWTANDGDVATFSDIYAAADGGHTFTLNGAGSQKIPMGSGVYGSTVDIADSGFTLRLRFRASDNSWLPW